jgi:S1-C subfamily serine protease
LALLPVQSRAEDLDDSRLAKLKDATVYVKFVAFRGLQSGSGCLFRKSGDVGWVLTCEHVVRAAEDGEVTVVFRSGREDALTGKGRVVASDPDADLACVRVELAGLPPPMELTAKCDARETETVYAAGFPWGQAMATATDSPDPTVTRISVTSLRRDDDGGLAAVQLTGDINAGNSGGPVVDGKGRFVGIAASKMEGTQTVFAIPPERVGRFLKGRIVSLKAEPAKDAPRRVSVALAVFDPMEKLLSAGAVWVRADKVKDKPAAGADGRWKPVSASAKEIPLKDGAGTFDVPLDASAPATVEVLVQGKCVGADGATVWTEPVKVAVAGK